MSPFFFFQSIFCPLIIVAVLFSCTVAKAIDSCPPICKCEQSPTVGLLVDCDGKNFNAVTETIKNWTTSKIDRLSIRGSGVSEIPASAFGAAAIRELDLSNNRISKIDDQAFINMATEFRFLNLSNNLLATLPKSVGGLSNLETLDLRRNILTSISIQSSSIQSNGSTSSSSIFSGSNQLKKLYLAQNSLSSISADQFQNLDRLTLLDLSDNNITTIAKGTFSRKIDTLLLRGNPLTCDQLIDWLADYVVSNNVGTSTPTEADFTCSAPPEKRGKSLRDLKNVSSGAGNGGNTTGSQSKADPAQGTDIANGLISSLIPGMSNGANGGNGAPALGGLLPAISPAISKLSGPLSNIITSNGHPKADDINEILKALPDMAALFSLSGLLTGDKKSLENLDLTKLPPQLVSYVAGGGQIPGVSAADLQSLTQRYLKQMSMGSAPISVSNASITAVPPVAAVPATVTATDFSNLSADQVNALINGSAPLPSLDSLPPDYVQTVLSGGALPGLTLQQTQTLKERYMQQMMVGGFGSPGLAVLGNNIPKISDVSANVSIDTTNSSSTNSSGGGSGAPKSLFASMNMTYLMSELKNLDLSQLPPDVIQSFLAGEMPDLNKIPPNFIRSIIEKSPRLFGSIVSAELEKKIKTNISIIGRREEFSSGVYSDSGPVSNSVASGRKAAPYDVNSLDRKADISLYHQDDDNRQARLWTAVVLGVVGLATVVLIAVLCWRRQRNHKSSVVANAAGHRNGAANMEVGELNPNSIAVVPQSAVHYLTVRRAEAEFPSIADDPLNVEMNRNLNPPKSSLESNQRVETADVRGERAAYTQRWVFASNPCLSDSAGSTAEL